jgi:hypothetical protein
LKVEPTVSPLSVLVCRSRFLFCSGTRIPVETTQRGLVYFQIPPLIPDQIIAIKLKVSHLVQCVGHCPAVKFSTRLFTHVLIRRDLSTFFSDTELLITRTVILTWESSLPTNGTHSVKVLTTFTIELSTNLRVLNSIGY